MRTIYIAMALAGTMWLALGACSEAESKPAPTKIATGPATWKLPMKAASIPPADFAAIMKAAGFKKFGKSWAEDAENAQNNCSAEIVDNTDDPSILDLNGDGNAEVIVTDSGIACYGMVGQGYVLLTWTGTSWRNISQSSGIPIFYPRKGSAWPDIEIGGPGFCFPRVKWSGKDYSGDAGYSYDNKQCKPPN